MGIFPAHPGTDEKHVFRNGNTGVFSPRTPERMDFHKRDL